MDEKYMAAEEVLKKYGQEHLLSQYEKLSEENKSKLLDEILTLDFNQIEELYKRINQTVDFANSKIEPIGYTDKSAMSDDELKHYEEIGLKAIKEGKIIIKDVIADAFLQNTLLIPEEYSVIATLNLNGDYISDQLAAMVGGIGIAPGANINYITGHAIFEATHGTAPNIAGKNRVNPSSLLLSGVMMLEYLGWQEAAANIVNALEKTFQSHKATIDLARFMDDSKTLTTTEFRDEIIRNL